VPPGRSIPDNQVDRIEGHGTQPRIRQNGLLTFAPSIEERSNDRVSSRNRGDQILAKIVDQDRGELLAGAVLQRHPSKALMFAALPGA